MTATCPVCGQQIVILHGTEPTEAMLRAALDAYYEGPRPEDARDFVDAMRDALTAALAEATA